MLIFKVYNYFLKDNKKNIPSNPTLWQIVTIIPISATKLEKIAAIPLKFATG